MCCLFTRFLHVISFYFALQLLTNTLSLLTPNYHHDNSFLQVAAADSLEDTMVRRHAVRARLVDDEPEDDSVPHANVFLRVDHPDGICCLLVQGGTGIRVRGDRYWADTWVFQFWPDGRPYPGLMEGIMEADIRTEQ